MVEYLNTVNIWGSYGQEFGVLFFLRHSVVKMVLQFPAVTFSPLQTGEFALWLTLVQGPYGSQATSRDRPTWATGTGAFSDCA